MQRERRDGIRQHRLEGFKLCIHLDPESLERPLRRMTTGSSGRHWNRVIEQLDESAGGDEGFAFSLGDDPASDPVRVPLFAVGS
jgi:hypothetical protein